MSEKPPLPGGRRPTHLRAAATGAAALIAVFIVVVLVAGCGSGSAPAQSQALPPVISRTGPESLVTPASEVTSNPTGIINALHVLGVDRVDVWLPWNALAPDNTSTQRPSVDLSDPASYSATAWAPYDAVVRQLKADHMGIDMDFFPPAPRWASGPGAPHPARQTMWKPNPSDFADFVRAAGTRYSGHYIPPGASRPLPRVSFWSIWNEPDLGNFLAPEATHHSQVEEAARLYRGLVDAAWGALHQTGHGQDTILFGELAPAGIHSGSVGNFNEMTPLRFLRALYCVDANYSPLSGEAAALRGCPTTAAASARFAVQNPALFHASGVSVHPYPQGLPPDTVTPDEPDYAELAALPRLTQTLDRAQHVYGSHKKFSIWSTEFGYQTNPPETDPGTVSPTTAAYYLNWAEYITYENPRVRSFDQYLVTDPTNSFFATGLLSDTGAPKPAYFAYRMPIFMPVTSTSHGRPLDVWGGARPAPQVQKTTHRPQTVAIQYRAGGSGAWRTLRTVTLTNPHGYFEIRQVFPGSGQVRLSWTPPHAAPDLSRTVSITVG
ncbi:MAG: hypothetical protein WAK93_12560 [Solirubrobacteraceae bacterium]